MTRCRFQGCFGDNGRVLGGEFAGSLETTGKVVAESHEFVDFGDDAVLFG